MVKSPKNLIVLDTPHLNDLCLKLHDSNTRPSQYRKYMEQFGEACAIEIAKDLPKTKTTVKTPLGKLTKHTVDSKKIGIINILRAGTPMSLGFGNIFPEATITFISAWRKYHKDGSTYAVSEYQRGGEALKGKEIIIVDPALATGVSIVSVIEILEEYIDLKKLKICALNAAKPGVKLILDKYPKTIIYSAVKPKKVNKKGYILNGPGDAGDRCFNTLH